MCLQRGTGKCSVRIDCACTVCGQDCLPVGLVLSTIDPIASQIVPVGTIVEHFSIWLRHTVKLPHQVHARHFYLILAEARNVMILVSSGLGDGLCSI